MDVNIKKIVTILLVGLALYFVISDPEMSAGGVQNFIDWLQGGAESIIQFLRNIFRAG